MAYAMQLAGFEVIDVHMTDLIEGRETLEDIQFVAFNDLGIGVVHKLFLTINFAK